MHKNLDNEQCRVTPFAMAQIGDESVHGRSRYGGNQFSYGVNSLFDDCQPCLICKQVPSDPHHRSSPKRKPWAARSVTTSNSVHQPISSVVQEQLVGPLEELKERPGLLLSKLAINHRPLFGPNWNACLQMDETAIVKMPTIQSTDSSKVLSMAPFRLFETVQTGARALTVNTDCARCQRQQTPNSGWWPMPGGSGGEGARGCGPG